MTKIGLGGGCHWCTEAIFQSLIGVDKVEQGFIASKGNESSFSEAVIVHYHSELITLKDLIEIHIHTHKSDSEHSMRGKYRSAIYVFDESTKELSISILKELQLSLENQLITKVLQFEKFKPSGTRFKDYYYNNPDRPFCKTYISPKLSMLRNRFSEKVDGKLSSMSRR